MPSTAMSVTSAGKVISLHNAGIAFTLGGAGNIKKFAFGKNVSLDLAADLRLGILQSGTL